MFSIFSFINITKGAVDMSGDGANKNTNVIGVYGYALTESVKHFKCYSVSVESFSTMNHHYIHNRRKQEKYYTINRNNDIVLINDFNKVTGPSVLVNYDPILSNTIPLEYRDSLVFRYQLHYAGDALIEIINTLQQDNSKLSPFNLALKNILTDKQIKDMGIGSTRVWNPIIDYRISREKLTENNYTLYVPDLDLLIVRETELNMDTVHPYSKSRTYKDMSDSVNNDIINKTKAKSSTMPFCNLIWIVDNNGSIGQRYFVRNNKVYLIHSIKDSTRENGVYVYESLSVDQIQDIDNTKTDSVKMYHPDDVIPNLTLYKNELSAKNACSETEEVKYRANIRKHELESEKLIHDETKIKMEAKNQKNKRFSGILSALGEIITGIVKTATIIIPALLLLLRARA